MKYQLSSPPHAFDIPTPPSWVTSTSQTTHAKKKTVFNLIDALNVVQHVIQPTHSKGYILDLVFSISPTVQCKPPAYLSWFAHFAIPTSMLRNLPTNQGPHKREVTVANLMFELMAHPINSMSDANTLLNHFINVLDTCVTWSLETLFS